MPARRIQRGGTRGTVYAAVARLRHDDAACLLDNGRPAGAIYLAGYAIECSLKHAICLRGGQNYLPASEEVHSWDRLVEAAGLWPAIKAQPELLALYSDLAEIWEAHQWGSALRYRPALFTPREAARLYREVSQLYASLIEMM